VKNVGAHGEKKERKQDAVRDKRKLILLQKRKMCISIYKSRDYKSISRKALRSCFGKVRSCSKVQFLIALVETQFLIALVEAQFIISADRGYKLPILTFLLIFIFN